VKLAISLVLALLCVNVAYSQVVPRKNPAPEQQLMLWSIDGNLSPWYFYSNPKFTSELRYNIDEQKTVTACIGKLLGKDVFSVIPEMCAYAGLGKGYGPEVWAFSETKRLSVSSYLQYAKLRGENSFGFFWLEGEGKASKHFQPGLATELEKDVNESPRVDLGLSSRFTFGKFVVNAFPLWTVTSNCRGDTHIRAGITYNF
jgi:hypothetical protein